MRSAICLLALMLTAFPVAGAHAFGGGGCGEGECSDCHTLTVEEARELLGDLVDDVSRIGESPIGGLWLLEVEKRGKKRPVYIDYSKRFAIAGNVVNLERGENITRSQTMEMNRVDVSAIPLADSLLMGSAEAPRKLVVFTDPQCPYCVKLHPELEKVVEADPGTAVYIKLFPLSSHKDAERMSRSIMCSGSLEMLEDAFAGREVPDPECENGAVERTRRLAEELGINSTPNIVLPDGRIAPGYREAEEILRLLAPAGEEGER